MYTDWVGPRLAISLVFVVFSAACGLGGGSSVRPGASQVLSSTAEWLEFEPVQVRRELFREVARQSGVQEGQRGAVLFPVLDRGEFVGAPALDARVDLLSASDAGAELILSFDQVDPFGEDRRESFQGLSEREAAELVARSLLQQWRVRPVVPVNVVRVAGAPYAAAWINGELRLNPAFVTMAAAPASP